MIELTREGDAFVLAMRNGENRYNRESVDAIHAALDEVEASTGPAALVVTGEGKFFSNGLDLDWMLGEGGQADPGFLGDVHRVFGRVLGLSMTTVAAVNGHAFAGGAMLVCAFDKRVMRDDRGYFCLPELDLGLPLTPGMQAVVLAGLPSRTAHDAITSAHRFGATEALAAGIVDEAVPEPDVLPRAVAIANEMAAKRSDVMGRLKHDLHGPAIDLNLAGGGTTPPS